MPSSAFGSPDKKNSALLESIPSVSTGGEIEREETTRLRTQQFKSQWKRSLKAPPNPLVSISAAFYAKNI
jgi:hypothetical protein